MNMYVIAYKGNMYTFEKNENELNPDAFMSRCWFIVKNIDMYDDYDYLVSLSHIWANHKFLGVSYDCNIMKEVEKCSQS